MDLRRFAGAARAIRVEHAPVFARREMRRDADDAIGAHRQARKKEMIVARPHFEARRAGRARIVPICFKSPLDSLTPATFACRAASSSSVSGNMFAPVRPGIL